MALAKSLIMTDDVSIDKSQPCPNCRAFNSAGALLCRSCGINFAAFQAVQPQILRQSDPLSVESDEPASEMLRAARQRLTRQVQVLLAVAAVTLVLALFLAALYAEHLRQRHARIDGLYQQALACSINQDYGCASNTLVQVLREEPAYPDAARRLHDARLGLARQQAQAGQWAAAVEQLDTLLAEQPGRADALALLRSTYDRWIDDSIGRGDLFTALRVRLQRQARFPND